VPGDTWLASSCAEVSEIAADNVGYRSYTVAAEVNIDTPEPAGILFAYGTLTLYIDATAAGSAQIRTQPCNFSLEGEGLYVGRDSSEPVAGEYADMAPFAFTGSMIKQVIVDASGDPYVNIDHEAQLPLMRD
jgi:hypothetical protein